MSDTRPGTSVPPASPADYGRTEPEPTSWVGYIVFAGWMLLLLGGFHAFQGFVALFEEDYYLVSKNGLAVQVDYTTWGWVHLILGLVVVVAGIGLMMGQMWARVVGVVVAFLSTLVNAAFLAAYPLWSTIMIAFNVLAIWAITVHGREMKSARKMM